MTETGDAYSLRLFVLTYAVHVNEVLYPKINRQKKIYIKYQHTRIGVKLTPPIYAPFGKGGKWGGGCVTYTAIEFLWTRTSTIFIVFIPNKGVFGRKKSLHYQKKTKKKRQGVILKVLKSLILSSHVWAGSKRAKASTFTACL